MNRIVLLIIFTRISTVFSNCDHYAPNVFTGNSASMLCSGTIDNYWVYDRAETKESVMEAVQNDDPKGALSPFEGMSWILYYKDSMGDRYLLSFPDEVSAGVTLWIDPPVPGCITGHLNPFNHTKKCMIFMHKYSGSEFIRPLIASNSYELAYSDFIFRHDAINATLSKLSPRFSIGKGHKRPVQFAARGIDMGIVDHTIKSIEIPEEFSPRCTVRSFYIGQKPDVRPSVYFRCQFFHTCDIYKSMRLDFVGINKEANDGNGYPDPFAYAKIQTTGVSFDYHYHFGIQGTIYRRSDTDSGYKSFIWKETDVLSRSCFFDGFIVAPEVDSFADTNMFGFKTALGIRLWREEFADSIEAPPADQVKLAHFWAARRSPEQYPDIQGFTFLNSLNYLLRIQESGLGQKLTGPILHRHPGGIWDVNGRMTGTNFEDFKVTKNLAESNYIHTGSICMASFSIAKDDISKSWVMNKYNGGPSDPKFLEQTFRFTEQTYNDQKHSVGVSTTVFDQINIIDVSGSSGSSQMVDYIVYVTNCYTVKKIKIESGDGLKKRIHGEIDFNNHRSLKSSIGHFPPERTEQTASMKKDTVDMTWAVGFYGANSSKYTNIRWNGRDNSGNIINIPMPQIGKPEIPEDYKTLSWRDGQRTHTGWVWCQQISGQKSIQPVFVVKDLQDKNGNSIGLNKGTLQTAPRQYYGTDCNLPSMFYSYVQPLTNVSKQEFHCIDINTKLITKFNIKNSYSKTPVIIDDERIGTFYHNSKGFMMTLGDDRLDFYFTKIWGRYRCASVVYYVDDTLQVSMFDYTTINQTRKTSDTTEYLYRPKFNPKISHKDAVQSGLKLDPKIALDDIPLPIKEVSIPTKCNTTQLWAGKEAGEVVMCELTTVKYKEYITYTSDCPYVSVKKVPRTDINAFTLEWYSDESGKSCPRDFVKISFDTLLVFGHADIQLTFPWSPVVYSNGTLRSFRTEWKKSEVEELTVKDIFVNQEDQYGFDLFSRRPDEFWFFNLRPLAISMKVVLKIVEYDNVIYRWFDSEQTEALARNKDKPIEQLANVGVTLKEGERSRSVLINHNPGEHKISVKYCEIVKDARDANKEVISCNGYNHKLLQESVVRPPIFTTYPGGRNHKRIDSISCYRGWIVEGDWIINSTCTHAAFIGPVRLQINNVPIPEVKINHFGTHSEMFFSNVNDIFLGRPLQTGDVLWVALETKWTKGLRQLTFFIRDSCEDATKTPWRQKSEKGKDKVDTDTDVACTVVSPPKDFPVKEYYEMYRDNFRKRFTANSLLAYKGFTWDNHVTLTPVIFTICIAQTLLIICGILSFFVY